MLIGTAGFGLYKIHPDSLNANRINHYSHSDHDDCYYKLLIDNINTIHRDRQGRIWVGTTNALYSFDEEKLTFPKVRHIEGDMVRCIADGGGKLFISDFGRGLIAIDTATGKEYRSNMYDTGNRLGNLCNDWIFSMYYDSKDFYWHRCRTLHIQPPHQLRFSVCRSQGT